MTYDYSELLQNDDKSNVEDNTDTGKHT